MAGIGVCELFVEFPFTKTLSSFADGALSFAVELAEGFSTFGFGDAAGFGLSTFFGLDLPVEMVTVLFVLVISGWILVVSSDFACSTFLGLDLPIVIVVLSDPK